MTIDLSLLQQLTLQLPVLQFDPAQDTFAGHPDARAYLDYYGINFAERYPQAQHGFGALKAEGFKIAAHYWLPPAPKATLVIVHGYYDHVGIYGNAIDFALAQNYAVLAFDLPGHGLSSGPRAEIDSFERYARVLDALLERADRLLPGPWYALGQSTGGTVLLAYLWGCSTQRFDKLALLAPLLLPVGWRVGRIAHGLLKRWLRQIPRAFVASSHDEYFNDFQARRDPLQARHVSVDWVTAMKQWDARFRQLPVQDKALLVIQGTGDQTVLWRYNLRQLQAKLPNLSVEMLEGARHHLINESETYRQPLMAVLARWFAGDTAQ